MKTLAIYNPQLTGTGGVVTFTHNFCKRMSKHYDITLYYKKANNNILLKIGEHVKIKRYNNETVKSDVVVLASNSNNLKTTSNNVIQVIHAIMSEQKKLYNVEYRHNPSTTKIVAVGEAVKKDFEKTYPYKVTKVINNMLYV